MATEAASVSLNIFRVLVLSHVQNETLHNYIVSCVEKYITENRARILTVQGSI
jgi:hypothetical protein